jgi:membrane protease YdiL (CAAX protease family)
MRPDVGRIGGFFTRGGLLRALGFFAGYAAFMAAFRLVVLTFITYFLMSSQARFQDISEIVSANEIMVISLGSLLFVILLRALNPLTSTSTEEIVTGLRIEKRFFPGFLHGAVLALGVVIALLLSGLYRYLGFYIQFEEAPLAVTNALLRVAGLAVMAYCEEFIFRHKIMNSLRRGMPDPAAAILTALLYCAVKALQFDLGLMHLATLFLLSLGLAVRTITDGDFSRGAGFWAGLLIVFHPLLSLPVLGSDFQGVLMVRYAEDEASAGYRLFAGGSGGPLSSFAFQLLLALDLAQGLMNRLSPRFKIAKPGRK